MNAVTGLLKQPTLRRSNQNGRRRRIGDSICASGMSRTNNADCHTDLDSHMRTCPSTNTDAPKCDILCDPGFPRLAMRLANTLRLRRMAWNYVYRHYREKILAPYRSDCRWYGQHDLLPTTHTFLVEHQDRIQGTITLLVDHEDLGLPADSLFSKELDRLRNKGSALTEVVSLVSKPDDGLKNADVLNTLMLIGAQTTYNILKRNHIVITVHPGHAAFYERMLAFRKISPARSYDRVNGAPAVLLELSYERILQALQGVHGKRAEKTWKYIMNERAESRLRDFIRCHHHPLPSSAVETCLQELEGKPSNDPKST